MNRRIGEIKDAQNEERRRPQSLTATSGAEAPHPTRSET
jgi:hypothetical protein